MRVLRIMLVFIVLVIGRNASAELRVCNDTPFRLSTAVGYYENGNWVSKGWYWVDAGDCIVPLGGNLPNRYYYVRAEAEGSDHYWGSDDHSFCTSRSAFTIVGVQACAERGYSQSGFSQVDVGNASSWTWRLTCNDCKVRSGWYLTFSLPGVPGGITIDGQTFTVPIDGWVKVDFAGSTLFASVVLNSDLSSLQNGLPAIIRAHLDNNDDCNYILRVHTISLAPWGQALRVYAAAHYEDWECPWTETPFGDVSLGKHRLFEQNGDATAFLTPQTDGNSVSMNVNVTSINADGLLGNVLDSDWFGPWIRGMIVQSIPQTIAVGNIQQVLPPMLQGFPIQLRGVSFYDRGGGRLALRTSAMVTVSKDYAQTVWERLQ